VFYRASLRFPSFWLLQAMGWCCVGLVSLLFVLPYLRQPWELGYPSLESILADQLVMCLGFFISSLVLRPICRSLAQRSLPWLALQFRALAWSLVAGTAATLLVSRLLVGTPDRLELLEACLKASVLLYLWCNLYFSIKQSQRQSAPQVASTLSPSVLHETTPLDRRADSYISRFSVRSGSRVQIIGANDVDWIAAAGDYCELHTRTGSHLLRETMKSLEQRLDPTRFARIHRSRIVCLPRILELRSVENHEYVVKLSDGSQHRCSRTYVARIESWLRGSV
jgi:hypothetical protein